MTEWDEITGGIGVVLGGDPRGKALLICGMRHV